MSSALTAPPLPQTDVIYEVDLQELNLPELRAEVVDFELEEGLSALPRLRLRVRVGPDAVDDLEGLHGRAMSLSLFRGGALPRRVRGVIRSATRRTHTQDEVLELDVVSALWLLGQTRDSRIYQDITAPELAAEIVGELLEGYAVEVREELTERYPRHEYLVQHRESHLEFLVRVLHEEGIWFTFAPEEDHEVLVLCDANENRPPIDNGADGRVTIGDPAGAMGTEVAQPVRARRWLGPTAAAVSGFDWTNPDLAVRASEAGGDGPRLEVYEHERVVRHYDYAGGNEQYTAHTAARHARHQRERLALSRASWVVSTNVVSAQPGEVIELVGAEAQDGRYVVLTSRARGTAGTQGSFSNALRVLPIELAYRPPSPARRTMPGPETATVVGPADEEVHVDGHGRVRVRFHWDRRAAGDERSSAWIRVSQAWAGPGHGAVFLPRVGSEVIVSYLGGDPDRPVITGSLYNGRNRAPQALPEHRTRTGFWSASTPGGGGYNELSFEDAAGAEQIRLHAQRDLEVVVQRDQMTVTNGAQRVRVEGDRSVVVRGGSATRVSGVARSSSGGVEATVSGAERKTVSGGAATRIEGGSETQISGGERRIVSGGSLLELEGALSTRVRGSASQVVDGPEERASATFAQTVSGAFTVAAAGVATLSSSAAFALQAPVLDFLAAGALTFAGETVDLRAPAVSVEAESLTQSTRSLTTRAQTIHRRAETEVALMGMSARRSGAETVEVRTRLTSIGTDVRSAAVSLSSGGIHILG